MASDNFWGYGKKLEFRIIRIQASYFVMLEKEEGSTTKCLWTGEDWQSSEKV